MYKEIGVHPEAKDYELIDLDKWEVIRYCIWADDEKGNYCVYVRDENGKIIVEDGDAKTEIKKGNIKLIKVRNL